MKADSNTFNEVQAALNDWADSYRQRDIQRLLAHISPDLDVVMYGTGPDEKRVALAEIRTQAERDWAQTDAAAFVFEQPMISAAGSVPCVDNAGTRVARPGDATSVRAFVSDSGAISRSGPPEGKLGVAQAKSSRLGAGSFSGSASDDGSSNPFIAGRSSAKKADAES